MRGMDHQQSTMFSYISAERRVPKDHPLRAVRVMVDAALSALGPRFDAIYAAKGRPSIAPEKLLRALLLQVLYTVRSERLLMEQLVQPVVPLVCGSEPGRASVGRNCF
jgi:transposase